MDELYTLLENKIIGIGGTGSVFNFTQVWNNQLDHLKRSDDYNYSLPCVLIEMRTDNFEQLGAGYQAVDMFIRFHIIQDFYNGDNMSENLSIFQLRKHIVEEFSLFKMDKCGSLVKVNEIQDYDHTNLYHYIVEYKTQWIDDTYAATSSLIPMPSGIDIVFATGSFIDTDLIIGQQGSGGSIYPNK